MNIGPREGMTISEIFMVLLTYAEDFGHVDRSHNSLRRLKEAVRKIGLQVKKDKMEYTIMRRKNSAEMYISLIVRYREFIGVKQLKCRGSIMTRKNKIEKKIVSKNKYFYTLAKLPMSRDICWRN